MAVRSHLLTFASSLRRVPQAPPARRWAMELEDPLWGGVRITGLLREEPGADTLLVILHGIGGCAEAAYAQRVAVAATAAGVSCLRLNMRGCDRLGQDFYHAGLSSDLDFVLASPEAASYDRIVLAGYSLGGHLALHYATSEHDRRLAAVAAVSAPLDLAAAARHIDRPTSWPYRRYVLNNLKEIYAPVAALRGLPLAAEEVAKLTTLRQWDDTVVAPRWGFAGADDYYRSASVGPRLGRLAVPALLVGARDDPMVPAAILEPVLAGSNGAVDVRWVDRAGHLAFPERLDLGVAAPLGLEGQVIGWLSAQR